MIEAARWLLAWRLLGVWREPTWIHLLALPGFLPAQKVPTSLGSTFSGMKPRLLCRSFSIHWPNIGVMPSHGEVRAGRFLCPEALLSWEPGC